MRRCVRPLGPRARAAFRAVVDVDMDGVCAASGRRGQDGISCNPENCIKFAPVGEIPGHRMVLSVR